MGPDEPNAEPPEDAAPGDNHPAIPHFTPDDPIDRIAFHDVLERLTPIDQCIAAMVMEGWTQAEIGEAVGLVQSCVCERVRKMTVFFKPFR